MSSFYFSPHRLWILVTRRDRFDLMVVFPDNEHKVFRDVTGLDQGFGLGVGKNDVLVVVDNALSILMDVHGGKVPPTTRILPARPMISLAANQGFWMGTEFSAVQMGFDDRFMDEDPFGDVDVERWGAVVCAAYDALDSDPRFHVPWGWQQGGDE